LRKVANRQTDKQRRLINLLGGGKNGRPYLDLIQNTAVIIKRIVDNRFNVVAYDAVKIPCRLMHDRGGNVDL